MKRCIHHPDRLAEFRCEFRDTDSAGKLEIEWLCEPCAAEESAAINRAKRTPDFYIEVWHLHGIAADIPCAVYDSARLAGNDLEMS